MVGTFNSSSRDRTVPILEFNEVSFAHPGSQNLFFKVNFSIAPGTFALVRGPSGSGKSTLLRLIARLEDPTSGQILFSGRPLADFDPPKLRRQAAYIQQTPTVIDASVRHNLLLPFSFKANQDLNPPDDKALRQRLDEFLLPDVDLSRQAKSLSVGQQQRLCLIRAMLLNPGLLLMDEPTSALDKDSRLAVEQITESMNLDKKITVIMVSHQDYRPRNLDPLLLEVKDGRIKRHN